MKPSWKDAPVWAKFLAMDEDGEWYWYEKKPTQYGNCWGWGGRTGLAQTDTNWSQTLEERPK